MSIRKYKPEQIVTVLRQIEVQMANGKTAPQACKEAGIHTQTYYRWRRRVEQYGLAILRPRERRCPRMPNTVPSAVEARVVAFSLGHPGFGPARIAAEIARPKWGEIGLSSNGVWRILCRHGLNTRRNR